MITTALSSVFSLILSLLPGSSVGEESPVPGESAAPGQVAIAVPGGEWVGRGGLTEELSAWSTAGMLPGDRAERTYLVRNLDARPGVWEVRLGDYEISGHGYFGVGAEAGAVPGGEVPDQVAVPTPGTAGTTWLLGPEASAREGTASAEPGRLLNRIELGSCEAAAVTDWVLFPDVSAAEYQNQAVEPKLQVSFTPAGEDPTEFIDGECDETAGPPAGGTGSSGSSGASMSGWVWLGLLLWSLTGFLVTASSWMPWWGGPGQWFREQLARF